MDSLLMPDLAAYAGLLAPTDKDERRAFRQSLMAASLNMLGRPKGAEWQTLGQAGLLGMGLYNQALGSIPQQRLEAAKAGMGLQELMLKQRAMQDAEGARKAEAEFYTHPPGSDTSQPAVTATTGGAMPKQSLSDQYSALARYLAGKGYVDQARKAEELALKFQRKLKDTKTLTQDGKRITVNFYDDGSQEVVPYGPDLEKAHFSDNGAVTGIPQDPFTGQQLGAGIVKSLTPDAMLADERARRGQDLSYEVGMGNLNLARQRFGAERANQDKPQVVMGQNGEVFTVDPRRGIGAPVMGPDGQPLSRGEKPLTEAQGKATVFANQMITASNELDKLDKEGFSASGRGQQAAVAMAASGGMKFVPGSAALSRVIAPEKAQRYVQAQRQWVEGFLRFQSGATITPAELENGIATYFPQQGDSNAVIAQKDAMRRQAENNMRAAAGAGGAAKFLPRSSSIREQADAIINGNR